VDEVGSNQEGVLDSNSDFSQEETVVLVREGVEGTGTGEMEGEGSIVAVVGSNVTVPRGLIAQNRWCFLVTTSHVRMK
jgi:hypothetical protein